MKWQDRVYIAIMGLAISTLIPNILGKMLYWSSIMVLSLHIVIFLIALQLTIQTTKAQQQTPEQIIKRTNKKTR